MRTVLCTSALALASMAILAPVEAKTLTTKAMSALPAKEAAEQAKNDLVAILQPTSKTIRTNEIGSLNVRMHAPAHYTGMAGLCVRDELAVDYDPYGPWKRQDDRPVAPTGFRAWRTYRVIKAPVLEPGGDPTQKWGEICAKIRIGEFDRWFPDDDPAEAAKAANVVWAAGEAVKSGRLQPKDCDLRSVAKTCPEIVLDGAKGLQIRRVARNCTSGAFQECYVVDVTTDAENSFRLTIVASFEGDSIQPKTVDYISADGPFFYN